MEGEFYLAEFLVFCVKCNDLVAVFSYSKNLRSTCFSLDMLTLTSPAVGILNLPPLWGWWVCSFENRKLKIP
jgi:hypothetical protein